MTSQNTVSIRHVINPVVAQPDSDLAVAQPITTASMRRAAEVCKPSVEVETCAVIYEEDRPAVPDWVGKVVRLERSVLDIRSFGFQRKLPLLADLLNSSQGYGATPDLIVYTNVDIALMPYFYEFVASQFQKGIDGMVINRRSIFPEDARTDDLAALYAEIGKPHPGRDCFVFTPDALNKFDLGLVCIGAADVGRVLLWNIAIQAQRFEWLERHHLTFHLGDDRSWDRFEMAPYHDHNNDEAREVLTRLETKHGELHLRDPWSRLLPRPPRYWAEQRWVEEPSQKWIRGQRKLRRRWRRARRRQRPW